MGLLHFLEFHVHTSLTIRLHFFGVLCLRSIRLRNERLTNFLIGFFPHLTKEHSNIGHLTGRIIFLNPTSIFFTKKHVCRTTFTWRITIFHDHCRILFTTYTRAILLQNKIMYKK